MKNLLPSTAGRRISNEPQTFANMVKVFLDFPDAHVAVGVLPDNVIEVQVAVPAGPGKRATSSIQCTDGEPERELAHDIAEEINTAIHKVMPRIIVPAVSNIAILEGGGIDARLDTGMKVREAAERAALWWEKTGRRMMQSHKPGQEFASKDEKDPNFIPSGILNGMPWEALERHEQMRVIKAWHHFYVRRPDVLDKDPNAKFMLTQGGEKPE